ncbi:phage head morphogenesis protein [Yersinia pekkanenii]|uniref:Head morphogenesis protein SPP1 gp7 n=1 Tax=Yersinia pekkanenii TaxID=1288385 RepID=A0A0T9R747_9GAMM|nr:phage minor head protein [Yersinia pekkanenii]CNI48130.1 putative head morphogenesis protein SPP1 gp7 [Yersinia pekkanenii]CRY68203.1 putative head morphogenesis protein SPP1 gp7 [Yersinia pekkanenii]
MAKTPRKMARRQPPKPKGALRGATLFMSVSAGSEYQHTITRTFDLLRVESESEIKRLFEHSDSPVLDGATLDGSLANGAAKLLHRLRRRFNSVFNAMTDKATARMLERVSGNAGSDVKRSLEEIGEGVSIRVNMLSPVVKETIAAKGYEAANLIKRVPAKYLDDIGAEVMRSISSGRGLQDLQPALDEYGVKVRNWSKNVALDQTRKVYDGVSTAAMKSAGIRKFEWVHSGGSNDPREYHMLPWPAGLNGGIFDIDDPPIIDKRTGERGFPGQLPYCRCTKRPIIDFGDDDE